MSALQSIDTAVFRFINETLQNSLFDRIMPLLAGGPWFLPLLIIPGAVIVWKGGVRARLCILMLAIIVPVGDGVITNGVKHLIERPRPCRVLAHVNLPMRELNPGDDDENEFHRGCSSSGGMPSGHTTNWFAATMIAWLFYRRTLRFMLPLACLVAFSRVYNGVHYPGDVIVGAALGAGYAVALVVALDALWRAIARRWFPMWFGALPSLVLRSEALAAARSKNCFKAGESERHWLRLGYTAIAVLFVWRMVYLASGRIELSEDEAYQWLWSKHLALSYFSKPPLIAYVQWLGTRLFGDNAFGVRFFSPVCAALGSVVVLRFFARHVSARAGFCLLAAMTVTPLLALGSMVLTVDPLLVFFWSLAMFAGWRAVQPAGGTKDWTLVGVWMGLAFLSKYTALLQWLCWIVFFLLWKPARAHLRRPGPYLALFINVLCATPVIVWNARNGWATAGHVANDAKAGQGWGLDWHVPLNFFAGTFGALHPVFFVAALWAAIAFWKRNSNAGLMRFFFAMSVPLVVVYAVYTLHSPVQINWIAASIIPLFCLMVVFWDDRFRAGVPHIRASLTIALLTGAFAVALLHETDLVKKFAGVYLPPKVDPLRRVRGWTQMAGIVSREREKLAAEGKAVFVIGGHYGTTSLLSFYMPEAKATVQEVPLVYYRFMARPNTQFYFWPTYVGARRGENAIYVQETGKLAAAPPDLVKQFDAVTEVGNFPVQHRGRVLHHVQIFACRNLQR